MSRTYSLKKVQLLNTSLEEAWNFFSSPANLAEITPKHLRFRIISAHHAEAMYPGQIIEYTVRPFLGIPLYWMTEITHVEDKKYFIDDQRRGPYSMWHHQHHFKETEKGVEMTDIVHYRLPLWFLGDIANWLFVRKELEKIFLYRYKIAEEFFNKSLGH